MPKIKSGGGITMNKVSHASGPKREPIARAVSPAAVSQMGVATPFPKEPLHQGKGYSQGPMPPTGIPGKYNSAWEGPGSGRTIYRTGAQNLYGPVNPGERNRAPDPPATKPGRDILSMYGPEATGKGR
jgi:hypothetical protein